MIKPILFFITLISSIGVIHASYTESWIVEGKVKRVFNQKETEKFITEHPEIGIWGKNYIRIQIILTKCTPVGGHTGTKCKKGVTHEIVLNYNPYAIKFTPTKAMHLRINYSYSDSAVPAGNQFRRHIWHLISILPKANNLRSQSDKTKEK